MQTKQMSSVSGTPERRQHICVENEVKKYDVDVSVKRELTWPEGAVGIPLMLAIAEELLRTAMVSNYIES